MRLVVKALNPGSSSSQDISVEADTQDSVEAVKLKLEQKLGLTPKENQLKLVFKGKTLQGEANFKIISLIMFISFSSFIVVDGNNLGHYQVVDGSKLHLMLKKAPSSGVVASTVSVAESPSKNVPSVSLDTVLFKALRKHFASDQDTKKVVQQFKKVTMDSLLKSYK